MRQNIPRVVIAASQSSSGKTTIVTGLLAALRRRGFKVQSYKVGPDYIDPGYHQLASGRPGHNLDTWLVTEEKLAEIFQTTAGDADIAIIEGVMGLFDGGRNGISSTASIAKLLKAPVLLVINAKSMGESAAALALGFQQYDPELEISGVILNRLGSETHQAMIEEALARLRIEVFGAVMRNDSLSMPERHLGLLPVEENERDAKIVQVIADAVIKQIDIDKVVSLANKAPRLPRLPLKEQSQPRGVKIAVARDEAFSFYYPESLQVLVDEGAEIVTFSPLHDTSLPDVDGLILGGGFPEMFAEKLYGNVGMRESIVSAVHAGMPVYAECGGFMYLMRRMIDFAGNDYPMLGLVPGTVQMNKKLQTVGYVSARMLHDTVLGKAGSIIHGHEFHFSSECLETVNDEEYTRAFEFTRMRGNKKYFAGYVKNNILGSYLHLHFAGCPQAAEAFVQSCLKYKKEA